MQNPKFPCKQYNSYLQLLTLFKAGFSKNFFPTFLALKRATFKCSQTFQFFFVMEFMGISMSNKHLCLSLLSVFLSNLRRKKSVRAIWPPPALNRVKPSVPSIPLRREFPCLGGHREGTLSRVCVYHTTHAQSIKILTSRLFQFFCPLQNSLKTLNVQTPKSLFHLIKQD